MVASCAAEIPATIASYSVVVNPVVSILTSAARPVVLPAVITPVISSTNPPTVACVDAGINARILVLRSLYAATVSSTSSEPSCEAVPTK